MRIEPSEYARRIETAHSNIRVVGVPTGAWRKVGLLCDKCGARWTACPANLTTSDGRPRFGCPGCRYKTLAEKVSKPSSFYMSRLKTAHPSVDALDAPMSANHKIRLQCKKCSFVWTQTVAHMTTSDGRPKTGCPNCKKSSGEDAVAGFLTEKGCGFEQQKRFEDCCDKRPLPFDFYVPEHRVLIEFQGEQHFRPTRRRNGLEKFKQTQKHDAIKKSWAAANSMILIEIQRNQDVANALAFLSRG